MSWFIKLLHSEWLETQNKYLTFTHKTVSLEWLYVTQSDLMLPLCALWPHSPTAVLRKCPSKAKRLWIIPLPMKPRYMLFYLMWRGCRTYFLTLGDTVCCYICSVKHRLFHRKIKTVHLKPLEVTWLYLQQYEQETGVKLSSVPTILMLIRQNEYM